MGDNKVTIKDTLDQATSETMKDYFSHDFKDEEHRKRVKNRLSGLFMAHLLASTMLGDEYLNQEYSNQSMEDFEGEISRVDISEK